MSDIFNVAVIGAGMVGSAAAKYLSSWEELKVVLIGPDEPLDKKTSTQSNYGSHYDEGRISRVFDTDKIKGILSQRSIARFRDLEHRSGVKFYNEVGCLITSQNNTKYLEKLQQGIFDLNAQVQEYDRLELKKNFPYFSLEETCRGYFEEKNAGYISARGIVKAQKTIAKKCGCKLLIDSANGLEESKVKKSMIVHLESGRKIYAKKVLIATGTFTNFSGLLDKGSELDLKIVNLYVIKHQVKHEDLEKLCKMPCIIHIGESDHSDWLHSSSFAMLPPILYPDGNYYIKLLYGECKDEWKSVESFLEWFRSDVPSKVIEENCRLRKEILPNIDIQSISCDTCAITMTPTNHPYIGMISSRVGVAVGGNGYAAKASDELGLIAARMIKKGEWDYDIPEDVFQPKFTSDD